MFEPNELNSRNRRTQKLVRILLMMMTVMLVLPVIIILSVLVVKGAPEISWAFLTQDPTNGMTEGGIFPALIGTVWLVAVALMIRSPEILVLGDPGGNAAEFVKRVRESGATFPILSVGGALGDARVAATLPLSAPLYVQAAAWKGASAAATRYAESFGRRYGYPPVGYSDTLPYDAATVLFSAIRAAGRTDSDAVVTALENGAFPAIAGTYRFDAAHQAIWGTPELHGIVIRWETGGARIVYPESKAR